jgi:hypothetical protein
MHPNPPAQSPRGVVNIPEWRDSSLCPQQAVELVAEALILDALAGVLRPVRPGGVVQSAFEREAKAV